MLFARKVLKKGKNYENSEWNIFGFFLLIAFLPALALTITFWLLGIKTIFYSENGTFRHRWFKKYIAVFVLLWIFIAEVFIILYVLYFLLKVCRKKTEFGKRTKKCIILILTDQLLIIFLSFLILKERTKSSGLIILLAIFLLQFLNAFFIHYFFSKPAIKILHERYLYYFPKYFGKKTWLKMKVDNLEFKETKSTGWPIMITLFFVNFQIIFLLLIIENYKAT